MYTHIYIREGEIILGEEKKILGEERRELIIKWLKESPTPLKGGEIANKTNVSRQVIVQDISLLKARNEPIIATSQGYIYLQSQPKKELMKRIIAVKHTPGQTKLELQLIVDCGVTVKDVIVEHPVYGDLTASIMVSNRKEVDEFIKRVNETNASYLSELTMGVHLHTIEADTTEKLESACAALKKEQLLLD